MSRSPCPVPTCARVGLALAYIVLALVAAVQVLGGAPAAPAWVVVAGLAWCAAIGCAARGAGGPFWILAGAVVLRIPFWIQGPVLSDDVHRYVWEGRVVLAGASPYAHAPAAPQLAGLAARHAEVHARVAHPEVSAVYPPLAQGVGALAVALGGDEGASGFLRAVYGLADLAVAVVLLRWLAARGRPPPLALAWAWCPLIAPEFAGSGHHDAAGILLLVLGLALAERSRVATACVALAALVKYLPIVALPALLRGARPAEGARRLAIAGIVLALGFAPFLLLDGGLAGATGGLDQYATRWEGFNLGYRLVERAVAALAPALPAHEIDLWARRAAAALWLALAAGAHLRHRDPAAATARSIGAFLVLAPVLHPWYVAWIVPFLGRRPAWAWTWLAAAAPLLYAPLPRWRAERVWEEPAWLWPAVALPFLALLLADAWRARRAAAAAS